MQYRILVATAMAATAFAQDSISVDYTSFASVLSVLETALPSSLIAEAVTNSAAVSSQIAAEFAEGSTPGWFQSLPSDVKTYLVPFGPNATTTATATGAGSVYDTAAGTGSSPFVGVNNTAVTTGSLSTSATTSHASASSGFSSVSASGSSTSSAGASMPTAIFGAGIAGAMGIVGLLAL